MKLLIKIISKLWILCLFLYVQNATAQFEPTPYPVGSSNMTALPIYVHGASITAGVYVGHGNWPSVLNTALGTAALQNTSSTFPGAYSNTGIGYYALNSTQLGHSNTAVGTAALSFANGANFNTCIGENSGQGQSSTNQLVGSDNSALGYGTLARNTSGADNCALGYASMGLNETGQRNTAAGMFSLYSLTAGDDNVALGYHAAYGLASGSNNIALGRWSDFAGGSNQLSIQGFIRGINLTGGVAGNLGVGIIPAGIGSGGILAAGTLSKLHVAGSSTVPPLQLDFVPSGTNSTNKFLFVDATGIVAQGTLPVAPTGINSCSNTGNIPLVTNTSGAGNLGCSDVYSNNITVSVGVASAATHTWVANTGTEYSSTGTTSPGGTYQIPVGTNYKLYVNGWTGSTGFLAFSDQRLKKEIKVIEKPLERILKISGYTYNWNLNYKTERRLDSSRQAGFLAQEILKVLPEAVVRSKEDGLYSLNYNAIMPLLTEGIKAQQKEIQEQEIVIANMQQEIESMKQKINQLIPGTVTVRAENFQIVPNPVTGISTVNYKLDNSISKGEFIVYDLQGKMLKKYNVDSKTIIGQFQLNKKDFSGGMYILSLVSNNAEIQSTRFIISD